MVANLNHLSLVKDYDLVGILHRTQAMSNYHNRLALIELIQVLHDITLVVSIERVGCLVKEDIVRILINSSRYQDALLLSLAQSHTITPNFGVELQRQGHHIILDASYLCGSHQTVFIYFCIIHSYVAPNAFREDDALLHHNSTLSAPPFPVEQIDVGIANGDFSFQHRVVTQHQSDERGLSAARCSHYRRHLALEGQINIGNTDINKLNKKWWRRQCGVVMQDGVIFSESIARNIAVDNGDIDKERLVKAAEIACIKDYVMALPLKFNTKIGRDGVGLSQGQKQRILIARAVYKNPDYIFLDEATNSLDANNERSIVENLDKFYKGKTVVIVAHRLSTVKNADQIVVIDHGKVVEIGNHESLTAKRGAYYNLVKNQLELGN